MYKFRAFIKRLFATLLVFLITLINTYLFVICVIHKKGNTYHGNMNKKPT